MWFLKKVELKHNHSLSPGKARFDAECECIFDAECMYICTVLVHMYI